MERVKHDQDGPAMEEVIKNAAGIAYLAGSDTVGLCCLRFDFVYFADRLCRVVIHVGDGSVS